MRPSHFGARVFTWIRVVCVILAVGLAATACTSRVEGSPVPVPGVTYQSGEDSTTTNTNEDTGGDTGGGSEREPSAGGESGSDGDGDGPGAEPHGAPFEPCQVISWDDLPGEKPANAEQAEPQPQQSVEDGKVLVGCLFLGRTNHVGVLWSPEGQATVEPSGQPGEKVQQIAGRPGLIVAGVGDNQRVMCMARVDLGGGRGIGGVGAYAQADGTTPDQEVCAVAARLAAELVKRTSQS